MHDECRNGGESGHHQKPRLSNCAIKNLGDAIPLSVALPGKAKKALDGFSRSIQGEMPHRRCHGIDLRTCTIVAKTQAILLNNWKTRSLTSSCEQ